MDPPPVSSLAPLPDALARVIGQAISKPPEARYQIMDRLVADLKALRREIEHGAIADSSSSAGDSGVSAPPHSVAGQLQSSASGTVSEPGAPRSAAPSARKPRTRRTIDSLAVLPLENASQTRKWST